MPWSDLRLPPAFGTPFGKNARARVARRLLTLELRPEEVDEDDFTFLGAGPFGRVTRRFAGAYTPAAMRTVICELGLDAKLQAQGLGDYQMAITAEDPFHHRLVLCLPEDGSGRERQIVDLRLHLSRVSLPQVDDGVDVIAVEWLLMQNPRRAFTAERPRLPGQRYPGTGLGRAIGEVLVLLCRRLRRDGLLTVPERFHLAEQYEKGGWLAVAPDSDRLLDEVRLASSTLRFAQRAWAVERGFVRDEHGDPVHYHPHERVLPVSERLSDALSPGGFLWLQRLFEQRRQLTVDRAGLAASLRADPVEGMDPDDIKS